MPHDPWGPVLAALPPSPPPPPPALQMLRQFRIDAKAEAAALKAARKKQREVQALAQQREVERGDYLNTRRTMEKELEALARHLEEEVAPHAPGLCPNAPAPARRLPHPQSPLLRPCCLSMCRGGGGGGLLLVWGGGSPMWIPPPWALPHTQSWVGPADDRLSLYKGVGPMLTSE